MRPSSHFSEVVAVKSHLLSLPSGPLLIVSLADDWPPAKSSRVCVTGLGLEWAWVVSVVGAGEPCGRALPHTERLHRVSPLGSPHFFHGILSHPSFAPSPQEASLFYYRKAPNSNHSLRNSSALISARKTCLKNIHIFISLFADTFWMLPCPMQKTRLMMGVRCLYIRRRYMSVFQTTQSAPATAVGHLGFLSVCVCSTLSQ